MGSSALFRLMLRPWLLMMLFFLFWAVVGPGLIIGSEYGEQVLPALRRGESSVPLLHYALVLGITLPATFGFIAAATSLDVQFQRMSWMLPGLTRRLTTGIVLLALPVAGSIGWLTARASDPALGVAAFAIALFWFAALLFMPDVAEPGAPRLLLGGAALVSLFGPDAYVSLVTAQPAAAAAISLVFAGVLFRRHTNADVRRRRIDAWSSFLSMGARSTYWRATSTSDESWSRPMVNASVVRWTGAAWHEMVGRRRHGPALLVAGHMFQGAIVYAFSPTMLLMLSFSSSLAGVQLRSGLLYPLSRQQRARTQFLGNLIDNCLVVAAVAVTVAVLATLGVPRLPDMKSLPPESMMAALVLFFALTPIAQWSRAGRPLDSGGAFAFQRLIKPALLWFPAAIAATAFVVRAGSMPTATVLLVSAAIAIGAQSLHFMALRWFYAHRDLA